MDSTSIPLSDYYNSPPFNGFPYSGWVKSYYLITGSLSAIGNLYLIVLFLMFSQLRQLQCNWLIIFLCTADVFVGVGTVIRGSTIIYATNNLIVYFPFYTCSFLTIPFATGYRTGQVIALMIALDRFVAVWKPLSYNKLQSSNVVLVSGIISLTVWVLLVFFIFYGMDFDFLETLNRCISPISNLYYMIMPTYSGIISIFFFGFYLSSIIILFRHLSATKKQQLHAQSNLSKVQMKVFITVSYALFCYSIFYVVPTILQMFVYYFNISGWVQDYSSYLIIYGGEFNGILNALIYIFKHQEFKNCSKQWIYNVSGKMKPVPSINNTTQGRNLFQKTSKSIK